jgi:hypothetical protein
MTQRNTSRRNTIRLDSSRLHTILDTIDLDAIRSNANPDVNLNPKTRMLVQVQIRVSGLVRIERWPLGWKR